MSLRTGDIRYTSAGTRVHVEVQPSLLPGDPGTVNLLYLRSGKLKTLPMAEAEAEANLYEGVPPRKPRKRLAKRVR